MTDEEPDDFSNLVPAEVPERVIQGIRLVCEGCFAPEQYNAFTDDGQFVGYLRLRSGRFTVRSGAPGAKLLLAVEVRGDGGCFLDADRDAWLTAAAVLLWLEQQGAAVSAMECAP